MPRRAHFFAAAFFTGDAFFDGERGGSAYRPKAHVLDQHGAVVVATQEQAICMAHTHSFVHTTYDTPHARTLT